MQELAKSSVLKRLKRIEGQVRGLSRKAEEEILADHVAHCVEHAIASGDKSEQRRKVGELIDVLSRSDR
jgi:CsoR family transcriptional regulator, copper-sensing transcriptional repressor